MRSPKILLPQIYKENTTPHLSVLLEKEYKIENIEVLCVLESTLPTNIMLKGDSEIW